MFARSCDDPDSLLPPSREPISLMAACSSSTLREIFMGCSPCGLHGVESFFCGIPMDSQEAEARIHIELSTLSWLGFPDRTRPSPTRLFHYTSQAGLLGIV